MAEGSTIVFAGGGTGGHLYPGIAVAQALRTILPGAKMLFLCTTRPIDKIILDPTGFEFLTQPIIPPQRSIGGLLKFFKSWRDTGDMARRVLRERSPAAAVGLGGYAAGAAIKQAAHLRIPTALVNPDVIPGKANQFLMKKVQRVCAQFAATSGYMAADQRWKMRVTGCPIRPDIQVLPPKTEAMERLGLDPRLHTLVVTGASQGALTVNEAMIALAGTITLNGWQILHLSGRDHAEAVRKGYREKDVAAHVIDFTMDMADVWAVADLALSRSGASSCAELMSCGVPSILMPYPFHRDLHQRANAKALQDGGAAVLVDDEKDAKKNADKLRPIFESLLYDAPKRQAMSAAAKKMARPDAAEAVAAVIAELVVGK